MCIRDSAKNVDMSVYAQSRLVRDPNSQFVNYEFIINYRITARAIGTSFLSVHCSITIYLRSCWETTKKQSDKFMKISSIQKDNVQREEPSSCEEIKSEGYEMLHAEFTGRNNRTIKKLAGQVRIRHVVSFPTDVQFYSAWTLSSSRFYLSQIIVFIKGTFKLAKAAAWKKVGSDFWKLLKRNSSNTIT